MWTIARLILFIIFLISWHMLHKALWLFQLLYFYLQGFWWRFFRFIRQRWFRRLWLLIMRRLQWDKIMKCVKLFLISLLDYTFWKLWWVVLGMVSNADRIIRLSVIEEVNWRKLDHSSRTRIVLLVQTSWFLNLIDFHTVRFNSWNIKQICIRNYSFEPNCYQTENIPKWYLV